MGKLAHAIHTALEKRRTAEHYRKAARYRSNAFWGWLLIAAVVAVTFGLKWALLPVAFAMLTFYQYRSATMMAEFMEARRKDGGADH
jgi:fatty acid desaturase